MKKKIIVIFAVVAAVFALAFGLMKAEHITLETGRILKADNGAYLFIDKNDSPIVATDMSRFQKMFKKMQTGDKVLIAHGLITETYPSGTATYFCLKLKSGDENDIPEVVVANLTENGWLSDEVAVIDEKTVALEHSYENTEVVLNIPESTAYKIGDNSMTLTPKGSESTAVLTVYPKGGYGVCGTGLNTESILDGKGTVGFYENTPTWAFIIIKEGETQFVFTNEGLSVKDSAVIRRVIENGSYKVSGGEKKAYGVDKANVKCSRVMWSDEGEQVFLGIAAKNENMLLDSKRAVPTVIINNREELDRFINDVGNRFGINGKKPYDAYRKDFMDAVDSCTDEFFTEKSLVISYVQSNSGSVNYTVEGIWLDGNKLDIRIEEHTPEVGTCDMAAWLISAELPKEFTEGVNVVNSYIG